MSRRRPALIARNWLSWLLVLLVAALLSGCAFMGAVPWWYGWIWLALGVLLSACVPEVDSEAVKTFSARSYKPSFDVSSLITGDGTQGFIILDDFEQSRTGQSVAVGHLTNPQFADIAVGSPFQNYPNAYGQVTVVRGDSGPFPPKIYVTSPGINNRIFLGVAANDYTGRSVAIVPSINGDGLQDLAIGSPAATGYGKVGVIFGATTLPMSGALGPLILDGTTGTLLYSTVTGTQAGIAVTGGDINGDEIGDIATGATLHGGTFGGMYEVAGTAGGWIDAYNMGTAAPRVNVLNGPGGNDLFGYSMAGGGNLDGDNYDDVIISARFTSGDWGVFARFGAGPSNLSLGWGELGPPNGATFNLQNDTTGDQHGYSVAMGDVNGDGRPDIIAGVASANRFVGYYYSADDRTGRVHVVFGSTALRGSNFAAATLDGTNGFTLIGVDPLNFLGSAVAVGDINGDGIGDIIVSAYNASPATSPIVYVIFGKAGATPALCHLSEFSATDMIVLHSFGYGYGSAYSASIRSIAVGDVDGDGLNDIVIGWPDADGGYGRVFVIFNKALQK